MPCPDLMRRAEELVSLLRERKLAVATAESCTGGLVAAAITSVPGASEIFDRGFVTYSNAAKDDMLGVPRELIESFGAVSAQTARAMAQGAIERSLADLAVAITGVAGPGGGSAEKPIGLVYLACARKGGEIHVIERRFGEQTREAIRREAALLALDMLGAAAQRRP